MWELTVNYFFYVGTYIHLHTSSYVETYGQFYVGIGGQLLIHICGNLRSIICESDNHTCKQFLMDCEVGNFSSWFESCTSCSDVVGSDVRCDSEGQDDLPVQYNQAASSASVLSTPSEGQPSTSSLIHILWKKQLFLEGQPGSWAMVAGPHYSNRPCEPHGTFSWLVKILSHSCTWGVHIAHVYRRRFNLNIII